MATPSAKENILKRIRQALVTPVPLPFPLSESANDVYHPATGEPALVFAQEFTKLQGIFVLCADEEAMKFKLEQLIATMQWTKIYCREEQWASQFGNSLNLESCDAAITGCENLVARTGSIVLSAALQSGRIVSVYAPVHICIAYASQVVYDIKDALVFLEEKYAGNIPSLVTFASGPSRTADIEKTLVTGVHGPKEVYLFLIDKAI